MNKIRVLQLVPSLNMGGMENQLLSFVRTFDRNRFEIIICCIGNGLLIESFRKENVKVIVLNKKPYAIGLYTLPKLVKVMKNKKIDIIHCRSFQAGLRGLLAAKIAGVPIIIKSYHGLNLWKKSHLLLLDRFMSLFTDKFIVVSNARRELMLKREKIRPEKVITIYNGVNGKRFDIKINIARQKREFGISETSKVVGIVASLTKVKDHKTFLNAAALIYRKLPNVYFLIVGDGELRNELELYCKQLSINSHVIFTGSRKDIPKMLSIMDIFVLSSLREDLCNALLEAMSARRPVVATNVGGNPEVVLEGETGFLVEPRNPEKMAEKILKLLNNCILSKSMGNKGRKRVEYVFSAKKNAEEIEAVYRHLYEKIFR